MRGWADVEMLESKKFGKKKSAAPPKAASAVKVPPK